MYINIRAGYTMTIKEIRQHKNNTIRQQIFTYLIHVRKEISSIDTRFFTVSNCEDLGEYISYLKDINFIFTQCPFLQCDDEILKFGSVDVGSNWLKLIIATTSTCMILNNTASLIDKSLILRSHYINLQQQEEMLKNQQIKNDIAIDYHKTFELLRSAYMDTAINELAKESNKTLDPEEQDKAKRTLEKLIILIDKGCEIYATLDSPDEVQVLFPEIQSHLELPDNIMKYLEDKEQ